VFNINHCFYAYRDVKHFLTLPDFLNDVGHLFRLAHCYIRYCNKRFCSYKVLRSGRFLVSFPQNSKKKTDTYGVYNMQLMWSGYTPLMPFLAIQWLVH
jgi:hypothetical protein